jgi:branched-chain amino acid transport system permease protein
LLIGQLIFDGMAMGLVYVILATGLVLITSVSRILFMAYGVFYTIGAYTTWYAVSYLNLPFFLSLFLGILGAGIIGALSYILIFQRLQRHEGGFLATLIASMGLSIVLSQGTLLVFGTTPRSIPTVFPGAFKMFGININIDKLVLIGLGIAVTVFLFWIMEKTTLGRAMRAVSFLPEAASLHGINKNMIFLVSLGMGTALAGFAGGIIAPSYGINPVMGNNILWTVLLMCMLGGLDSLFGAVAAGFVIGQILSFGQFFIGGTVQIILFFVIGIILYFKPTGLLGRGVDIGI